MPISIGIDSALNGINKGFESFQKHASQIASVDTFEGNNSQSLAEAIVGLKVSELQIKASMQVVETLDDVLGTLLDVKV